ncbi:hypothetical protein D3C84_794480 [compost metagenome]
MVGRRIGVIHQYIVQHLLPGHIDHPAELAFLFLPLAALIPLLAHDAGNDAGQLVVRNRLQYIIFHPILDGRPRISEILIPGQHNNVDVKLLLANPFDEL